VLYIADDLVSELFKGELAAEAFSDVVDLAVRKAEALHTYGSELVAQGFFS